MKIIDKYIINFFKFGFGCYYLPWLFQIQGFSQLLFHFVIFSFFTNLTKPSTITFEDLEKINTKQDEIIEKLYQVENVLCEIINHKILADDNYHKQESEQESEQVCVHEWKKVCKGYDDYWKVCIKCNEEYCN